jgi:hypothetical protein
MPRKHCSPREVANEVPSLLERAGLGRLRFSAQVHDRAGDIEPNAPKSGLPPVERERGSRGDLACAQKKEAPLRTGPKSNFTTA